MGVGFPACLKLNEFGKQITLAFGNEHTPYHVGSSLEQKRGWRDVDVRLLLPDEVYEAMGLGDPARPQENQKWCAICLAWSVYGQTMTGLPIDFQIQQMSYANEYYSAKDGNRRSALGIAFWMCDWK